MIAGVWSNIRQRQTHPPVCSNGSQFPIVKMGGLKVSISKRERELY